MTEARLLAPDGGFRLTLPASLFEAIAELAAEKVLERIDQAKAEPSPYLSVPEAADYLRCSKQRIYDLLSSGRLTRFKDGSRTLVLAEQLDAHVRLRMRS